jgi:hypothetical protein
MFDTGLTNELMALNTGFENSVTQAEQQAADTYWVITSNAKGDQASPFTGDTAQVVQMTEQELQQVYQDSGQIQDQFGSFENYMTYIGESQDWVQSAEWMNATVEYNPEDKELLYQLGEDAMWKPGEREDVKTKIDSDLIEAKRSAYNSWLNEGAELMDKWGLNDTIYNSDGDQFKWTGSGYQKTIKVDDHADFGDYFSAILPSVVLGFAATPLVAGALTPYLGAAGAKAAAAGVASIAVQGMKDGKIDWGDAFLSAALAYGGTQLSEALQNSGVMGQIEDQMIDAVGAAEEEVSRLTALVDEMVAKGSITDPSRIARAYEMAASGLEAGAKASTIMDAVNKFLGTGVTEVVWDVIDAADKEGEFDPDADENPYDPGLIDPQLPKVVDPNSPDGGGGADGDGISDSENEPPNDPLNGEDPNQGQYEVVQVLEDGSVVVNDNRDGDVWILPPGGDYQVGDIVPESDMTDARVGDGDLNSDTTDPNAEPEPEPTVVWPDVLGGYVDPTVINPNTGDDAVTAGDGNNGAGESGNNGDGVGNDGTGEGDGGDGNGDGSEAANNQWIDGSGGTSNTQWTRLFEQPQFRSRFKQFQTGMFAPQSKQLPAPAIQDYSAQRMGLLSQAYKDLS